MGEETPIPGFAWLSTQHYSERQRFVIDVVTVAVISVLTGLVLSHEHARVHGELWTVLGWVTGVGTSLLILLRRRHPWAVLVLIAPPALVCTALRGSGPAFLYMVMALYVVVSRCNRRTGAIVVVVIGVLDLAASILNGGNSEQPAVSIVIGSLALIALAWLAGDNTRQSRLTLMRRREQARAAASLVAAEREEQMRRKIADERVLIARELHDVVAHTMSVIAVRAGVGRMVLDSQPDEAGEALKIIETTARSSLAEMRLMVQILRGKQSGEQLLGPLPGLDELERLAEQVSAAGVDVALSVEGAPRELLALADLTAYRIVQEALTNVVRHAGPTRATVRIAYLPDQLEIEVLDEGPAAGATAESAAAGAVGGAVSADGAGHGLVGMRERAAMFGGTLEAGPLPGHGFRVHTLLNVDAAPKSLSEKEAVGWGGREPSWATTVPKANTGGIGTGDGCRSSDVYTAASNQANFSDRL